MKLSDAFEKKTDNPELELVCKVYNINFGKNEQLLEQCLVIKQYMIFVNYVRYYHKEQDYDDLERAINRAIDRCIEEDVLADFLKENRSEVVKVTQLDYTFDRQITLERNEAREEGWKEGREEGREELANVIIMLKTGITKESLLKEGIKEDLINLAMTLIS